MPQCSYAMAFQQSNRSIPVDPSEGSVGAPAEWLGQPPRSFWLSSRHNGFSQAYSDLVEHGIVARKDIGEHGERFEYRLTPKGDALLPVLSTLREWGDEWIFRAGNEPLIMTDRAEGEPLALTQVLDAQGNVISRRDIRARSGPGADEQTKTLFGRGESESK